MHKVKRGSTPVVAEKLQRRSSSIEAPAEKGVLVEVVLLAPRQKRQQPRALLTGTDLRRTFQCWPLSARFRSVVFLARRAVDMAPNHTSEKWAQWATAIWGTISAYWRASHARRSSFRLKGKNQSFRRRVAAQKIERLIIWCFQYQGLVNRFQILKIMLLSACYK